MWNKPWTMKEGFAVGAGLIVVGLMLELSIGAVDWSLFRWPVNIAVLAVFILSIITLHSTKDNVYAFRFLSTAKAAVPALVYGVALTIIMGLTPQTSYGTWFSNMLSFWPFVLIYAYIAAIVGLVALKQITAIVSHKAHRATWTSLVSHIGLFIVITTATLGNADMQRLKMITAVGESEWRAIDQEHKIKELPIAIELKKFIMEEYEDGTPKRFASDIQIFTKSGKNISATVDVNKPAEVDGWKIYQYGYDTDMGAKSNISIFEIVSDPWLPAVYSGILMMLCGAVLMLIFGGKSRRKEVGEK